MSHVSVILNFSFSLPLQSVILSVIFPRLNLYQCHCHHSRFPCSGDHSQQLLMYSFALPIICKVSTNYSIKNNHNFLLLSLIFLFKASLFLLLYFTVSKTQLHSFDSGTSRIFSLSCSPYIQCRFLKPIHFTCSFVTLYIFHNRLPLGTALISGTFCLITIPSQCGQELHHAHATHYLLTVLYFFVPLDCKLFGAGISVHPIIICFASCKVLCKSLILSKNNK